MYAPAFLDMDLEFHVIACQFCKDLFDACDLSPAVTNPKVLICPSCLKEEKRYPKPKQIEMRGRV